MWSGGGGGGGEVCRSFVHLANTVSLRAETLRKVGDGYRADECRQACVESAEFVCVAAQMHLPSTCFVTGYRLRNDYISVHYTRVCQHGPSACAVAVLLAFSPQRTNSNDELN